MLDKRLMKEIKENRIYFIVMAAYGMFTLIFSVCTAFLLANIVNFVFVRKADMNEVYGDFIYLFLLLLIKTILTFYFQRYFKLVASTQKNKILVRAVSDLLQQGPIITSKDASGGIVTSWVEAADNIEPFYSEYLPQFFSLVITVPLLLVIAFTQDWISGCIMLVTGPLLPFFLSLIGMQSKEANQKRLEGLEELGDSMLDFLNGIRTLKVYNGEKEYRKLIMKNSEEFRRRTMQVLKIAFLSAFVLEFAATISTAMIAVSLGIRLMYDKIDFYTAFFILLITPDYYMAIRKFGAKFHTALGAKAAADNLYSYNKDKTNRWDYESKLPLKQNDGIDIQLKHISFQYEESKVKALSDISITLEHGKLTAIVGKSGSGKSTLAYVLMRFIEAEGEIFFNHLEISKYNPEYIRNLIAYIPQKPHVFHDTLKNNLLLSKQDATEEELWEALENAALTKFAQELPSGMDTILTEIGSNISVGEAQRLAFARAYLKNCPIVIMDETTSALDVENENLLRQTFEGLFKVKTVLVIAHRLETVENADVICVLEDGLIKETGNHKELMSINGRYKELVETWGEHFEKNC